MGPLIIALLFTDLAGHPIDTLDLAIFEGQDNPAHREQRSAMLHELLDDPTEEPYDRFRELGTEPDRLAAVRVVIDDELPAP